MPIQCLSSRIPLLKSPKSCVSDTIEKTPKSQVRYSNSPENMEKSHNFPKTEQVSVILKVLLSEQQGGLAYKDSKEES